ncbi:U2 small nuclear ribonucleoprotein A' [Camellia lanceoleosa]|uniref:U2 small nuclear ribonucleoprotein A n=1 Tax=Camellia lanceoleosa TaxID=1840588 RepID=A0ACC0FHN6_9ERIC|nr:U2 small nuclear ribonucleoprotein A' [Camellia lanceoleosa]
MGFFTKFHIYELKAKINYLVTQILRIYNSRVRQEQSDLVFEIDERVREKQQERDIESEREIESDQFDTIDLSDNEIVNLENFPYLNRLGTLLVNNNRITRINPSIGKFMLKLHTLVLTNNRLTNLVEIDPLASLTKLQFPSLLDNNITKKPNYRLYVIHKLKSLHVLDFKKVKHKERIEAHNLFSSQEAEEEGEKESAKTFIPGEAAIVNSQTLEEVARLEKALKSGQLPADLKIGDNDGMTNNEAAKEDKMVTDEQTEANDGGQEMLSLNRRIMNPQK